MIIATHCNLKTDIWIAKEAGYDALEIVESKLLRPCTQPPSRLKWEKET
jgi:hypothetical protein